MGQGLAQGAIGFRSERQPFLRLNLNPAAFFGESTNVIYRPRCLTPNPDNTSSSSPLWEPLLSEEMGGKPSQTLSFETHTTCRCGSPR
nr:hypothetical protein GCM10025732_56880 [Glycomyces mayteni]